jgi:hypothetical protein
VCYAVRRSGSATSLPHFLELVDGLKRDSVGGDQVFCQGKIKFVGRERTVFPVVIHRVHDNEQMRANLSSSRGTYSSTLERNLRQAIFDCERMG